MKTIIRSAFVALLAIFLSASLRAEGLSDAAQAKLNHWITLAKQWAADPMVIKSVAEQNRECPPALLAMTQEKWETLSPYDPFVSAFTKTDAALMLKTKRSDSVAEAFISDAHGLKVAFLAKTTSWSHQGNPKHDVPMSGQFWQGKLQVDKSAATAELQISVPVLEGGKSIGSLVVGLTVIALSAE